MSTTSSSRLKILGLVGCVVIVGLVVWACVALFAESHSETTNDAYVVADFTLVAPRIPGQLSEVLVEDNQQVKTGQLLVRIDDRDFRAALASAQADVEAGKKREVEQEQELGEVPDEFMGEYFPLFLSSFFMIV